MIILYLTLKKKWFDLIDSEIKKEEYREIKEYWDKRLFKKDFDAVSFRNGYGKNVPEIIVELLGIEKGYGNPEWGAPTDKKVYILKLGKILKNC